MKRMIVITLVSIFLILGFVTIIWFTDFGGIKKRFLVSQIVKMRVSPKRLENPKNPLDYGMDFKDVDIMTEDGVRLSAWEIPAKSPSDKTIIVNHALTTTRYGAVEGLDGVPVEYLPMLKHLHENGYNIITYDHRGQGESDGGLGRRSWGKDAAVGAGVTEWQDVIGSLNYVKKHDDFADDEIAFISHCMGANATFLAWSKRPELFNDTKIKSLVAIQPTVSYNMVSRFIKAKIGMDLVDAIEESQIEKYGYGYANPLETIKDLSVPVLFAQVKKDIYTFDSETRRNDIEMIYELCPTEKSLIWIGSEEAKAFGTDKRFDGYGYFNEYPDELLTFLNANFS